MSVRTLQPWIDAYTDLQADIQTFSFLMTLADLTSDADYKLVVADLGNGSILAKLKVYRGTSLAAEIPIIDNPTAVLSLYTDNNEPNIPGIAVICGNNILIYRNCRPYFKCSLPALECSSLEADVWRQKSQPSQLVNLLEELSKEVGYSNLSAPTQALLALEPSAREEFAFKHRSCPIKKQITVSCATTIKKSLTDTKSVECIVLATESSQLFVVDPEIFSVAANFSINFVAALMSSSGLYTVDYQVLLISRTGCVQIFHSGVCRTVVQLTALPISLVQQSQFFITANMDNTLQCFSLKGNKQWSVTLPGAPITMTMVPVTTQALNLVAVAINKPSGGCLHLYAGPQLMHAFVTSDPVSSLVFGRYGQEEHALVSISNAGALSVKLLKRTANFGNGEKPIILQNQPNNIKLSIPKKSKIFVEQTLREREQCKEMHSWFHRSWIGMSLKASECYLNALKTATVCQREALKLTIHVVGLGPKLKISLFLDNLAVDYVPAGLAVTFLYDPKVYTLEKPYITIPMLVPGLTCCLETLVTCELAIVGSMTAVVFANRILLTAIINMPPAAGVLM
uniref:Uncharacterized protein n=1 Tax=Clastoptera arizonana TaxID=38151 RepID=A0A1B6E6Y3_9HEMI